MKRPDELHMAEERKATRLSSPVAHRIFSECADARGCPTEDLRWSRFTHLAPGEMYTLVSEHVFPSRRTRDAADIPCR
jgi:type I restriction enzyme M protein